MDNVQDCSVLFNNSARPLYVRVGILTCGQDPRDCIMSTKREVLADNTSSTPPLFIAVPVSSQGEW